MKLLITLFFTVSQIDQWMQELLLFFHCGEETMGKTSRLNTIQTNSTSLILNDLGFFFFPSFNCSHPDHHETRTSNLEAGNLAPNWESFSEKKKDKNYKFNGQTVGVSITTIIPTLRCLANKESCFLNCIVLLHLHPCLYNGFSLTPQICSHSLHPLGNYVCEKDFFCVSILWKKNSLARFVCITSDHLRFTN